MTPISFYPVAVKCGWWITIRNCRADPQGSGAHERLDLQDFQAGVEATERGTERLTGGGDLAAEGHQVELERALAGLRSIQASGKADLPAVVKAIGDAGISFFESPEGQLSLGAVVTFADTWAGTAQPILDDERTRAFLAGAIRGFELALAQPKSRAIGDPTGDKLLADAVKTRPAKRAK